jgi:glycosyltransferase involved in cell wall biosynthesis
MAPEPVLSGVIPVRDGEARVGEAIESMLGQTRPPDQIVVVDNGSSDRTGEVARSYGEAVEVVEEPRGGVGPARNAGIAAAAGSHIAFLDHDDVWEPQKLEVQLGALLADPELDLVFGHAVQVLDPGLDPDIASRLRVPGEPQPGLHLATMLATRRAFELVGPFSDDVRAADGLEWILGARDLGLRELMLDDLVLTRRIHGANSSFTNHSGRPEWARTLKASLDRRRGADRA